MACFALESVNLMSLKDNSDKPSQNNNGHPLINALSQFGRSFFASNQFYPGLAFPQNQPEKVVTIWERLQNCEIERKALGSTRKPLEGIKVQRLEPKEPIDFLEYCRRRN